MKKILLLTTILLFSTLNAGLFGSNNFHGQLEGEWITPSGETLTFDIECYDEWINSCYLYISYWGRDGYRHSYPSDSSDLQWQFDFISGKEGSRYSHTNDKYRKNINVRAKHNYISFAVLNDFDFSQHDIFLLYDEHGYFSYDCRKILWYKDVRYRDFPEVISGTTSKNPILLSKVE